MLARAKLSNPYVAGKAISRATGFYGREDLLQMVERELSHEHSNAIVLYGQRRIGKTSILKQLERRLAAPAFCAVYFDLQDKAESPVGRVLAEIAEVMADRAGLPAPNPAEFDDRGLFFRQKFLPRLYEVLGETRPVLLFDEFDVLDLAAEKDLPEQAAANRFFPVVRTIMESEEKLAFVFVIGRKVEDLSLKAMAVFKAARGERVSVLKRVDAELLIRTAEREGTLRFADTALDRILELTANHPMFTQLLCQMAWDSKHPMGTAQPAADAQAPLVNPSDVDELVPRALGAGENYFEWIWNGLPPAERLITATIAGAGEEKVSRDRLEEVLQNLGIRILTKELDIAPEHLVEWEILRRVDSGYVFFIELLRRWISLRKPVQKAKDELYRINPHAENLYQSGYSYYRNNDPENAIDLLRRAVQVNPNHLKARLLLAQSLHDSGRMADEVAELEQAYRYDEDAVRQPLARALMLYAESVEQSQPDEALAKYERVLEIVPGSRPAADQRSAIWLRRGNAAVESGDLDAALLAFDRAGAADRLAETRELRRRREIAKAKEDAQAYELVGLWDKARDSYEILLREDPESQEWRAGLERVSAQERISRDYEEGESALGSGRWEAAMRALANVVYAKPDFRSAARLLADAVEKYRTASTGSTLEVKAQATAPAEEGKKQLAPIGVAQVPAPVPAIPSSKATDHAGSEMREVAARNLAPERTILAPGEVLGIALSPTGKLLAVAGKGGYLHIYDTANGALRHTNKFAREIVALQYNASTSALHMITGDGAVLEYSSDYQARSLGKVTDPISLAVNARGTMLAAGTASGTVEVIGVSSRRLATLRQDGAAETVAIAGGSLAASSSGEFLNVWSGRKLEKVRTYPHPAKVTQIALSSKVPVVVTGAEDGVVRAWEEGKVVAEMKLPYPVVLTAYDADEQTLVVVARNGGARFIDMRTRQSLTAVAWQGTPKVRLASLSWRGRKLAMVANKEVRIWNLKA